MYYASNSGEQTNKSSWKKVPKSINVGLLTLVPDSRVLKIFKEDVEFSFMSLTSPSN